MSYSVDVTVSKFRMTVENQKAALAALKSAGPEAWKTHWSNGPILDERTGRLDQWLEDCEWIAELDSDYALVRLDREHETLAGNEEAMFGVLAPFVEPGAVIEFLGEDGDRWRYVFDGKTVAVQKGKTNWK